MRKNKHTPPCSRNCSSSYKKYKQPQYLRNKRQLCKCHSKSILVYREPFYYYHYLFLYSANWVLFHIKVCLPSTGLYKVMLYKFWLLLLDLLFWRKCQFNKVCLEQGFEFFNVFCIPDVFWEVIPTFCCSIAKTPVSKWFFPVEWDIQNYNTWCWLSGGSRKMLLF